MTDGYSESFANVYDRLFSSFTSELAPRLYQYFMENVGAGNDATLLDLCCGTGLVARYFAQRGVRVVGLDASPAMIRKAAEAMPAGLAPDTVELLVADARRFTLARKVDACVSIDNAMNHIGDLDSLRACARCVKESLRPGGWFLFDLNTPRRIAALNGAGIVDTPEQFQLWRNLPDREAGVNYTTVTGFVREDDGTYTRFDQALRNWILAPGDVRAALLADGWRSVRFLKADALGAIADDPDAEAIVVVVANAGS